MITELAVSDPVVQPGAKLKVNPYNVRNFRLHKPLDTLSRLCMFLAESRSNNATAVTTPQDARTVQGLWKMFLLEWERGKKFRDGATGTHERFYVTTRLLPTELQSIQNMKIKSAALEIDHLMDVIIASDSAALDVYIGGESLASLEAEINNVGEFLTAWLGDGADADAIGVVAPEGLRILGQLKPDADLDAAVMQEPSIDVQPPRVPDVPDVDVRNPGS